MLRFRIAEHGRVIGITVVLAALYLILQQAWLALPRLLSNGSYFERPTDAELELEQRQVARLSEKALQSTPASVRRDVWQLGFYLGYTSQFTGSFAMSAAEVRAKANEVAKPILLNAHRLSLALGLAEATPLVTETLNDFTNMTQRVELDETGMAGRVQNTFSPHHRHLFLLGMHLGTESARIEGTGGKVSLPPRAQIRRHATLTGIPPALWKPLAAAPGLGEQPGEVVARYRSGLAALEAALSAAPKRR